MTEYCPQCLALNVVATINGPTCAHQAKYGADWFPPHWDRMTEQERVDWIWVNRTKKT